MSRSPPSTPPPVVLHHAKSRYICRVAYQYRHIPKDHGFIWCKTYKHWYTTELSTAVKLREYASESTKLHLNRLFISIVPWLSPLPTPPDGLTLKPHQPAAIRFALERNRSALGCDPGLGKTIIAAMIARALKKPVVYICPVFLVRNVEEEFKRWAPEIEVMIYPDSQLSKMTDVHSQMKSFIGNYDTIFIDEFHRFKNNGAKRTDALFGNSRKGIPGIVDLFSRQIYLSGTPMPNRPMELYAILSKAAPETIDFMSQFEFGRKYCAGFKSDYGWDFSGASNVSDLARRVIAPTGPFMLRQRKELLNLPPKIEEIFIVAKNLSPKLAKLDHTVRRTCGDTDDVVRKYLAFKHDKANDDLHVMTYRRLIGLEKVKPTVEYINSIIEETDEKILVFAYHTEVIAALNEGLGKYNPLMITGQTNMDDRHQRVKTFQHDPTRRIMLANYIAAGVGFTMTAASRVIMVEFDWVPGVNSQAADRAHRIGQTKPVYCQYVVFRDSIDRAVIESLLRKKKSIDLV